MPRTPFRLPLLASSLALLLAAQTGLASAQQSSQQTAQQSAQQTTQQAVQQANQQRQATQNQAPPKLERVDPNADLPASSIPSRARSDIKETRGNDGQVTEVEVTSSGSHYYMKPNNPPGNAVPGSVTGNTIRAPQWKVGEFDLSGKRKAATETGTNTPSAADAPPPPLPAGTADKK